VEPTIPGYGQVSTTVDQVQSSPGARRPRVCIVDDDPLVTASLRSFLELDTDFEVLAFESPVTALELLRRQPVDVVLSDFLMPGMNGLEFLRGVRTLYPDVPRIMLTGYADKDNAIRAINEVGLYQYVEKPWENDSLKLLLNNAVKSRTLQVQLSEKLTELDRAIRQRDVLHERDGLLTSELELARNLIERLLPQELPHGSGMAWHVAYKPALDIGGDFYDVMVTDDGHYAMLLADITGHGIQAALSMALLKFAFASIVTCGVTPVEALACMNDVLARGLPEGVYVAAMAAVIDPETGKGSLANAGLPHPYIVGRASGRLEAIASNGLLLGVSASGDTYDADLRPFQLEPGDQLLGWTDGITESRGKSGDYFDDGALQRLLDTGRSMSSGNLVSEILEGATKFAEGDEQVDDMTILSLSREPAIS
jgi:sigma-B regulation protein RsbU (phosphoserine phosphatase)